MRLKLLDWAILRELMRWEGNQPQGALRFPVSDLAKRTGAHPNTVRARLIALREGGVVEGAVFDVWPRAVRLVRSGWMLSGLRPPVGKELAAFFERFPSVNGAPFGLDWIFPHVWERTDAEAKRRAALIARDLGAERFERHFTSGDFPPSPADGVRLSPVDWRLLFALRRSPQRSLAGVAKAVGVTARMAERRAKRLFDARVGGMFPILRPARIEGEVVLHFLLVAGDERGPGSLAKAFPERIAGPWGRGINAGVMTHLPNLDAVDEARSRAERLPGVERLDVLLYRDIGYSGAFTDFLEAHVAAQQLAVAPA